MKKRNYTYVQALLPEIKTILESEWVQDRRSVLSVCSAKFAKLGGRYNIGLLESLVKGGYARESTAKQNLSDRLVGVS